MGRWGPKRPVETENEWWKPKTVSRSRIDIFFFNLEINVQQVLRRTLYRPSRRRSDDARRQLTLARLLYFLFLLATTMTYNPLTGQFIIIFTLFFLIIFTDYCKDNHAQQATHDDDAWQQLFLTPLRSFLGSTAYFQPPPTTRSPHSFSVSTDRFQPPPPIFHPYHPFLNLITRFSSLPFSSLHTIRVLVPQLIF